MTTAPTGENPMNSSYREDEDLTVIKSIGPARQQWLRESFNVRTYGDLAVLSADEIESRLKAEGRIASRSEIEQWIAPAQELAAGTGEGEWQPFASFVVEFQAREVKGRAEEQRIAVSHMPVKDGTWQEDKRTEPIVIEGERLYQWMQNQVGERMLQVPESPEEKPSVKAQPAPALPVTVEVTQVQAFQPPQTERPIGIGKAGQSFSGFVRSGEPFALKASFGLAKPGADDIVKRRTTYNARFHVRNLITRAKIALGDTKATPLVEGEVPYTVLLPPTSLQPGVYRLWALVTVHSTPPSMGYLEVPLLQVV